MAASRVTAANVADVVYTRDLFRSVDWWAAVCQSVDVVIHAAWYAEPGVYMQSPKNLDCLAGTLQLASGCVKAGVQRFVGIGSCSEYDMRVGHLSIDTPLSPTTPYAGAKAATFLALSALLPQQGIAFAWARLFYLYGEGEDASRLVPYLRARLSAGEPAELTSGTQIRDYLDVAAAGAKVAALALGTVCGAQHLLRLPRPYANWQNRLPTSTAAVFARFGVREAIFDPPCVVGIGLVC